MIEVWQACVRQRVGALLVGLKQCEVGPVDVVRLSFARCRALTENRWTYLPYHLWHF